MKLSKKGEYACLAILDLAERYGEKFIRTADICKRKGIPKSYLEQIILMLRRNGYIQSARGAEGGHRLAKPPSEICIAEIIRAMDGPIAPVDSVSEYFYSPSPIQKSPGLVSLFKEIRDYVSQKLEHTTFADLVYTNPS